MKKNEFNALDRGMLKHPDATLRQRRERMLRHSTDNGALELHSCRALSSQLQPHST